jgi:hypothetical protein
MTCPCVIAMIDADGSADPGEIPQLVRALVARADLTEGTGVLVRVRTARQSVRRNGHRGPVGIYG